MAIIKKFTIGTKRAHEGDWVDVTKSKPAGIGTFQLWAISIITPSSKKGQSAPAPIEQVAV